MARFYKSAGATPLDYMYRTNTPLMEKVIAANDEYITENLQQLGGLDQAATTFPYLEPDAQRAKEIADSYSQKIDELTTAIRKDPANWRRQLNPIRDVSKTLQKDFASGEISKIAGNYSKYKQVSDYIDKQTEQFNKDGEGISADRAESFKQLFLRKFIEANPKGTAYNPQTGEFNAIKTFNPMNNMDIRKTLAEELDKMKADGEIRITDDITGTGEYFNKQTQKWEGITPDKIVRILTDRLNNPQLMNYLLQDSMAGIVKGVFDTDPSSENYGKFIAPYSTSTVPISSTEQRIIDRMKSQIEATKNSQTREAMQSQLDNYIKNLSSRTSISWNNDSYLAPIMRGIVSEYSYQKTDQENDLSANPIWQTKFNQSQANYRNKLNIESRERMQQNAFDNAKQLQAQKLEDAKALKLFEWQNKPATTKPGTPSPVKPGTTPAIADTTNKISGVIETTPFYYLTEKGKMSEAINDEVSTTKNSVTQLEKSLEDIKRTHPDNSVLIASTENELSNAKAKLATLESRRGVAVDYAINQWKNSGGKHEKYTDFNENMVRSFLDGSAKQEYDKALSDFRQVEAKKASLSKDDPNYQTFLKNEYYPTIAKKNRAEGVFVGGQRLFNTEIRPYSNNKLEESAKNTTEQAEMVSTTKTQNDRVTEFITADPSRYKIFGSNGKEINGLSFDQTKLDPKKIQITGVSATTGIGDKGVQVMATIDGKKVIITSKGDDGRLNQFFADEFKKSKDPAINNIGTILGSPTASTLSDMVTEMRLNTSGPSWQTGSTNDQWTYRTIVNPMDNKTTMRIRSRSINMGGKDKKWEFQFETTNPSLITSQKGNIEYTTTEDGKGLKGFVPLKSTKNPDGIYHNLEDILSVFPKDK